MRYKNTSNNNPVFATQLDKKNQKNIERDFHGCVLHKSTWTIIDNDSIYMAKDGDYIIKDKYGNISFCPKDIFEGTYGKEE